MKYSCNNCADQEQPCILDIADSVQPEIPLFCPYNNNPKWEPMKDFEMNGICSDCSNCGCSCSDCDDASGFSIDAARAAHGFPSMSESLKSDIAAANKISAIKNGSPKDPKSRYYDVGGLETLDIIKAKLTHEQYRGFLLGNIIKYSCRANYKGEFDRDIEKARFYGAAIFDTLLPDDSK